VTCFRQVLQLVVNSCKDKLQAAMAPAVITLSFVAQSAWVPPACLLLKSAPKPETAKAKHQMTRIRSISALRHALLCGQLLLGALQRAREFALHPAATAMHFSSTFLPSLVSISAFLTPRFCFEQD
jgi:hypothetical protein